MTKAEYEDALYTAQLVVAGKVSDWAVGHRSVVELSKALVLADKECVQAPWTSEGENKPDPGGLY